METHQEILSIQTRGRGTYDLTGQVEAVIRAAAIDSGLCHVFCHHTSASLILCENADPTVRSDLEAFMSRLVQDGDPNFRHRLEGPDDMAAHIRSILTNMDLTFPVSSGRSALGTWQGVYLWEHRTSPHRRRVTVTVQGS
ncbi:MAG TPA: YjbQ family protein [Sedimenticola thiotaurini]|uniref:YjbQ family protein n=1 Tax=Sedimenticola thiotaurini TaxID=1543721 RepID=A0A831RPY8_9GAMM|nr:YjbQ family protein [Sedimenticola thiotaurini]